MPEFIKDGNASLLEGKTAIVTGAARGIGAAIAVCFAQHGANIVLNSRSGSDALYETAEEITKSGRTAHISIGDISDSSYVISMVQEALKVFGSIDILVNNAGIIKDKPLLFMKESEWDAVINTSLGGAFHCTKAALKPMMKQRWGRIINIASITALAGRSGQTNYGSAKAGLIGFTKSLAREVASHNVLVNAAVVGVIDTRMTRQIPRDTLKQISEMVPLGRIGRPEEVANVCLFLASEMSSYVTGTTINVSGGGYI
jgi:3-oxoacyl-[acyl-carrier protein] reductase